MQPLKISLQQYIWADECGKVAWLSWNYERNDCNYRLAKFSLTVATSISRGGLSENLTKSSDLYRVPTLTYQDFPGPHSTFYQDFVVDLQCSNTKQLRRPATPSWNGHYKLKRNCFGGQLSRNISYIYLHDKIFKNLLSLLASAEAPQPFPGLSRIWKFWKKMNFQEAWEPCL